jgi:phytanoyl-CoA hydroxylase
MNPILNFQDVPTKNLGKFREDALAVALNENIKILLTNLFGELPKLMQSMYFEGNTQTWPHQDSYYLDSEKIGSMAAAWFALEDIKPGAGRFFVYPRSHLIDMFKNEGNFDVAFNHERYKKLNREIIEEYNLQCVAPALNKGDVLFWHSKTIHGSLETRQPDFSRSSLTAHYIPESHRFLQFQSKIKQTRMKAFGGWLVNHPKSLDTPRAKAILYFETRFPRSFQFLKWGAVKLFVTK